MNLIANEMMKLFKRASTYIMIGFLALAIIGAGGLIKYSESTMDPAPKADDWKQSLVEQNKSLKESIKTDDSIYKKYDMELLAKNEYRLKHDIPPTTETNVWTFMDGIKIIINFISIITITVAAGIVANEFSTGTIKLLLIRPASRFKILFSKYASVMIFSLSVVLFAFTLAFAVGAVLFGFGDAGPYLAYTDGQVVEKTQIGNVFFLYMMSSVGLFMLTTMAFMISAAFRNSSLAIGIAIFLLLMGPNITQLIAMKYEWAKYILFANIDLLSYFSGHPMVEGMTLTFSIIMLCIYFVLFNLIAFLFFTKRDVAA
ncbi:ABC transporter permease [Bacillus massiliigorillae]|uniref:ABC transporter permease n=1 Tax=Bacillus massiliigorillae TaxID=1243664 RepID=UPI00039BB97A|nr:ABC transporter permease [Bacillus massiliigorillae]